MRKLTGFITAAVIASTFISAPAAAADVAVAAIYNDAGMLVYSDNSVNEGTSEGGCVHKFVFPKEFEGMTVKYFGNCTNARYEVTYGEELPEETPAPTVTPAAVPTATPAPAKTPAPTRTPYPEVYERSLDAVNAPAVVESVNESITDGETVYETTMLYQGELINTKINDRAVIISAPETESDIIGSTAAALEEGDVIHFTCNLQGKVKSIDLIFRPSSADHLRADTQNFIGNDNYSTYYFGIPVKKAKGYMELLCPDGKVRDIDLRPGVFVYSDNAGGRGETVSLAGTGSGPIIETRIPDIGEASWETAEPAAYVLARVRNGSATEVIQFEQ